MTSAARHSPRVDRSRRYAGDALAAGVPGSLCGGRRTDWPRVKLELAPGDDGYWRPRFGQLREALAAKLTADARRSLRGHETVGSEAYGAPHGWWTEPRWH